MKHLKRIFIETIPHSKQRYETCGDWWWDDDGETLQIRVSDTGDWRYNAAVAIHELTEVLLCRDHGVSQEAADGFDMGPIGSEMSQEMIHGHHITKSTPRDMWLTESALLAGFGLDVKGYNEALEKLE